MPVGEVLNIIQIGDVAVNMHAEPMPESRVRARGRSVEMLDSYRVALPHLPYVAETREHRLNAIIYGNYQRSTSHLFNQLHGLLNRVTDVIAVEVLDCSSDNFLSPSVGATTIALWLHNRGRITDFSPQSETALTYESRIDLELFSYWQPLNPALWYASVREFAVPGRNQRPAFAEDEIAAFPTPAKFFDIHRPLSFQKKIYSNTSFHYDPTYFTALAALQDENQPHVRFASDWLSATFEYLVIIDPQRWNVAPLSMYLFKDLTGATTITITVTHHAAIWAQVSDITTIDVAAVDIAVDDAGFTLVDTDILVVGDVDGHAYVVRAGVIIAYCADALTRTGGAWPGQLHPGDNTIHIVDDGATHAQHHIYRRH